MDSAQKIVGFVYVMTNESMPGIVKVGRTSLLPEDRARDLYTTGVPRPFKVMYRSATSRLDAVERRAHESLEGSRINAGREFFRVSVQEAVEAVQLAAVEVAGIASWESAERHQLRSGDRIALTLEAGQVFALVAYPSWIACRAKLVDLWQAHSSGDLLEILVTDSASEVAGFSDGDPGGAEDPVPYLDRARTIPNGMMNGRERLLPGDRVVWIPAQRHADEQASVVFEASNYCQVVSRTWSPRLAPEGMPLLLNVLTCEASWPAAARSIREALALPMPRCWAPREGRDSSWEDFGSVLPSPERWLPQLKPRVRKR
jgi:hypothetical protein